MPDSLAEYHYDYSDSFAAESAMEDDLSPEQLARAVFEGASRPVRWLLLLGFRYGLNLRSVLHRQILPRLLRHAASHVGNSTGSGSELV
jgi:hypothetical protein